MQICPVGALTATPYRFTARPWDLDQVESTCTTCSVGCRVAVQSSSNRLTRLLGIDTDPVNHGWLCDKGRFAFEAVNGDESTALAEPAGAAQRTATAWSEPCPASWQRRPLVEPRCAERRLAAGRGRPRRQRPRRGGGRRCIGGARLTNEAAYAWAKLAKGVIGTDSVDAQLGDGLPAELVLGLPRATIDEACAAPRARDCWPATCARSCRSSSCACARRWSTAARRWSSSRPAPTALTAYAAASLRLPPGRRAAAGPGPGR